MRGGLVARLALREAAGWLAAQGAWVHPHDLALRSKNLAGRFDTAAQIARPRSALPSTVATAPGGWDDPEDLAALAASEQAAVRALALARLLTALPRSHDPLSGADSAARFLAPLGGGDIDPPRFPAWRDALPGITRGRTAKPTPAVPPLLAAADAARAKLAAGQSFASVAAGVHLKAAPAKFIGRDDPSVPANITRLAFAVPQPHGAPVYEAKALGSHAGAVLLAVTAVRIAPHSNPLMARTRLEEQLRTDADGDVEAYITQMRAKAKVRKNPDAFQ